MERALAIFERTYGRDHPQVALALFNLGVVYGRLGDTSKKRELLERTLAIFKSAYGTAHPQTKICQRELAKLASTFP